MRANFKALETYLVIYGGDDDSSGMPPKDRALWEQGRGLVAKLCRANELEQRMQAALPPLGGPAPHIPRE